VYALNLVAGHDPRAAIEEATSGDQHRRGHQPALALPVQPRHHEADRRHQAEGQGAPGKEQGGEPRGHQQSSRHAPDGDADQGPSVGGPQRDRPGVLVQAGDGQMRELAQFVVFDHWDDALGLA